MDYNMRIPLRLEDLLAAHFSWKFIEALDAAESGDLDLAFHLCDEMRLRPDIDDFRKAMVNLFLAHAVNYDPPKATRFAWKALNILEVIRMGESGYSERGVSEMEKQANELVLHLEMEMLGLSNQGLPADKNVQEHSQVSEGMKKKKAAEAVMQIEMVLDPEYEHAYGVPRGWGRLGKLAEAEASSKQDMGSDMMDCD